MSNASGADPISYAINTNPGVFQTNTDFSVAQGSYVITVKDGNDCTATVPATVGFTDNLSLQVISDTAICAGESVTLATSGNATSYSWSPAASLNDASASDPIATPSATTNYSVTATLGSCTRTAGIQVSIIQSVTVDAGPTRVISSGGSAVLQATASGASDYTWSPATGLSSTNILTPTANPAVTTVYTITASNNQGCVASDTVSVIVIPNCIEVRNAFSPNGDGNNDLWRVYDDYGCLKNVSLQVFNRYGNKVYESRDYRNTWDGKYNGKPVPDGTYYAVIHFTLITGRTFMQKTDLTIIR
jgi:gliding motility-associated-like protein